ncbi:MAG: hypothetical protein NVS9B13_16620 [Candidatus Acidiferrum sp.]
MSRVAAIPPAVSPGADGAAIAWENGWDVRAIFLAKKQKTHLPAVSAVGAEKLTF